MWALPFMAGSRDSLFSSHFLWCNSSEPKISWFICLFILWFCNRMVPWDTVSSIRAVLGSSQSSQTITTPSAVPAQDSPHHTDQELKQDTSVTALTHCHIVSVCPGSALPSWPHWQERFWSTAWLGTPQAENNRTKQRIPLLLWKWVVSHFAVMTNAQPMFRILLPFS